MRRIIITIFSVFLALVAMEAGAAPANGWTACSNDLTSYLTQTIPANPQRFGRVCLEMDNNHTGDESFYVPTVAKICVSTDVTAATEGALTFDLDYCPGNAAASANTCPIEVQAVTASGCWAISAGRYFISISAQPGLNEEAIIEVRSY